MTTTEITIHLHVKGMMCQKNCGSTVRNALLSCDDAIAADAIFTEQRAFVVFSAAADMKTIQEYQDAAIDIVDCVGFDCSVIENIDEYMALLQGNSSGDDEGLQLIISSDNLITQTDHEIVFQVGGMSCAVCTGRVERALQDAHPAVRSVSIMLATARAVIEWEPTEDDEDRDGLIMINERDDVAMACEKAVRTAGYECHVLEQSLRRNAQQLEHARTHELQSWKMLFLASVVLTLPMFLLDKGYLHIPFGRQWVPSSTLWTILILSSIIQFGVGHRFYQAAWKGWIHGRVMGMDFLVVLGTSASYVYSIVLFALQLWTGEMTTLMPNFMTGGMLLTFVTLGKYLESYAKGKTASALQTLMELQPLCASRVTNFDHDKGSCVPINLAALECEEVDVVDISVGDYLMVLPGSRIPTDGKLIVASGTSNSESTAQVYIDESALSGEPFPVAKRAGDTLFGSTVNQLSPLMMRVTAIGGETTLSKIVKLMENAQRHKAPIQALADKIACVFAPCVIFLSLTTFALWLILNTGVSLEERFFEAIMSAISVIVVACPCALGLATPTAVMVGTGVGANQGLLIKGGIVLENMHRVNTVIFDKTGTLTTGRAVVRERRENLEANDRLNENKPDRVPAGCLTLWLAACAEAQSEHPLGKAIVNAAKKLWGGDATCSSDGTIVSGFSVFPGDGVECCVRKPNWGERRVRVGSQHFTSPGISCGIFDEDITRLRLAGQVVVQVSVLESESLSWRVIGIIGIVDPVKDNAKATVAALQNMGIDVWICTGDHEKTAIAVANEIGIDTENICAGVTPVGKADLVSRLQKRRRFGHAGSSYLTEISKPVVAMIGDGINDSVALARADIGIAIGAGTEIAIEAADVVLVRSSLEDVVVAIHLSHVVLRRIIVNFVWAMGYNLVAIPFAAGVLYPFTSYRLPPELAGLMMAFSSVSVVTSSLLLKNYTRPSVLEDGSIKGGSGILSRIELLVNRLWIQRLCCSVYSYKDLQTSNEDLELV